MSRKEKLIKRLLTRPKDFTFEELESLLSLLGYELRNKGKTSGSRVIFISDFHSPILLHKPHGRNNLLVSQVNSIIKMLESEGLI